MNKNRYMIILLGSSKGIESDLNNVADPDTDVHYVDGTGIFIGTFFSHMSSTEIQTLLSERPAFMLFDISNNETHSINLPSKYYEGLFPEIGKIIPKIIHEDSYDERPINVNNNEGDSLTDVNEIIDKLEKNNFDRNSLTKKEQDILDNY